ncbi:MAG: hypothetical protein EXR07_17925 [Acetobacteraceae bacterium]|nr:hypothetical protein [Acetobacteraceae bacterium]
MNIRTLPLSLIVFAALLLPARADDVVDQINEALTAYGKKDMPTAIAGLEAALNLLRQGRADTYGRLLPGAPAGWRADEVETIAIGLAMAGGGTGASRKYHKGDDTVTVSILADSPMMQALSAFASSGIAGAAGGRTQIVNGRRTIYMKDDGSFSALVGDRIMVRVEGRGLPEATLKQFLTAVDFAAVEKAGK